VPGSADETGPAEAGYRPLLFSIAYGMTGSVGDAEDIVQDAFLGLTRARRAGTTIADPKAYLTTAVTRLGINHLGSARVRRERYVGDWLPEPVVPAGGPGPAGHAGPADSLSMAFLNRGEPLAITPAALPTPAGVLASHRHHDHAGMAALAACADHAVPAYAAVEPTREQQR
jgi:Sigma-70 region 2